MDYTDETLALMREFIRVSKEVCSEPDGNEVLLNNDGTAIFAHDLLIQEIDYCPWCGQGGKKIFVSSNPCCCHKHAGYNVCPDCPVHGVNVERTDAN